MIIFIATIHLQLVILANGIEVNCGNLQVSGHASPSICKKNINQ